MKNWSGGKKKKNTTKSNIKVKKYQHNIIIYGRTEPTIKPLIDPVTYAAAITIQWQGVTEYEQYIVILSIAELLRFCGTVIYNRIQNQMECH